MLRSHVRSFLIMSRPMLLTPGGSSVMGIDHASRMFGSAAPALIAMRSPSPVLVGMYAGLCTTLRRAAPRYSGFHSKPPVARTTPSLGS